MEDQLQNITLKSMWNMDEARMRVLNTYLILCEDAFLDWDLPNIYLYLQAILRVISGKLSEKEFNGVKEKLNELEEVKRKMDISEEVRKEDSVKFYNKANDIYIKLNRLMKNHGMFFREGADPRKAVLRR